MLFLSLRSSRRTYAIYEEAATEHRAVAGEDAPEETSVSVLSRVVVVYVEDVETEAETYDNKKHDTDEDSYAPDYTDNHADEFLNLWKDLEVIEAVEIAEGDGER